MAARKPPATRDIVAALTKYDKGRLVTTDLTAIQCYTAEKIVKDEFRTTPQKAAEWLRNAISDPDGELIGLVASSLPEWTSEETAYLRFDSRGRLNLEGHLGASISGWHITRRDQATKMRAAIRAHRAVQEQRYAREQADQRRRMHELHGDAVDVIRAFVGRMNDPTGQPLGDPVEERFSDGTARLTEQAGSPARVSITLCGQQIDAFAELIGSVTR